MVSPHGSPEGEFDPHNYLTIEFAPMEENETSTEERRISVAAQAAGTLKKPVDTVAIVPQTAKISTLTRKLYNVLMHHAQAQGDRKVYQARLRDVINILEFNSNNTEPLKEYCRNMVSTRVEWQSPTSAESTRWGVSGMLAHVEFAQNTSGELILEWSYAPVLQQAILDPQRYARVSIAFVSQLRTHAALTLYEICSRYVNVGRTSREHWTWWRPVLTGAPDGSMVAYNEWKYFKRDCVAKAVAEVNLVTDLEVEMVEHRQGRAIGELQFQVRHKVQQKLPLRALPSPVDLVDIGRAINLGVQQAKAEKLYEKFGAPRFRQALDALEARVQRKDLEVVRRPESFLTAILSAPPVVEAQTAASMEEAKKETKAKRVALLEGYRDARRKEAESLFREMPAPDQAALMVRFEGSLQAQPAVLKTYASRGLNTAMTRSLFAKFLADDILGAGWDQPSDAQLLDHAIG